MLKAILTVMSLFVLSGCVTASVETNKGDAIMAALKKATGGAALDSPHGYHETGAIERGTRSGTYETWGNLHKLQSVSAMTMDGATFTRGFNGDVAWALGPDGSIQIDRSPEGVKSARLGTYLSNSGYLYPKRYPATYEYLGLKEAVGKFYDVITVTPKGLFPIDLWLDPNTHLLQRMSGMDGEVEYSGYVEKYKKVDGANVVFALTQSVGGQDVKLRLDTHTYMSIDDNKFSPPEK